MRECRRGDALGEEIKKAVVAGAGAAKDEAALLVRKGAMRKPAGRHLFEVCAWSA